MILKTLKNFNTLNYLKIFNNSIINNIKLLTFLENNWLPIGYKFSVVTILLLTKRNNKSQFKPKINERG